jgi:hypothetical protein
VDRAALTSLVRESQIARQERFERREQMAARRKEWAARAAKANS